MSRYLILTPAIVFLLACSGLFDSQKSEVQQASDPQKAADSSDTCCSIAQIEDLCRSGVSETVIFSTLDTALVVPTPRAEEVVQLSTAGCPDAVILKLQGEEPPEDDAAEEAPPPTLDVDIIQGKAFIDLRSLTDRQLTRLTLVVNGQYSYKLSKLAPRDTDSIRKGSFKDKNGTKFNGNIKRIYIRADQGVYSQRW